MSDRSTGPYHGFRGRIGRTMAGSEPDWPDRPSAAGLPNVVIVMLDDVGFSDLGCYGGEIRTPNLDRLAAEGVQLTNFHVTPMCSPTRAALLTGVNPHRAGVGHVAQDDPGFPGYRGELAEDVTTIAEVLRDHGYATLMVGKWHLCRDADVSAHGPMHSWPCQRGFQRFYGILDAFTNLHQPHHLVADNHVVDVDRYPDGYYLTDDLTDQALRMVKERKASHPHQPFLLYLAHPAAHAPLHAMPEDIERYADTYSVGWDEVRRRRFERQLELGLLPPGTELPPRNTEPGDEVQPWDELSPDEQRVNARYMAVYAAMIDRVDQTFGRLRATLTEMGEWDNTILVFCSDNGASREGEATGTTNYYNHLATTVGAEAEDVSLDMARFDEIGGPTTMPHYPRGWAMASNTPFRLYKRNTHAGGHTVPCIWHAGSATGVTAPSGRRDQYAHCIDVLPTLLDLLGLPTPSERHGRPVKSLDGVSLAAVLAEASHGEVRNEQVYELAGNRGLYRDGWEAVTNHRKPSGFDDAEWELYHVAVDRSQTHNLAASEPERVADLSRRFDELAHLNQIYPMDEGSGWRWIVRRPDDTVFEEPVTIWPGTPPLEHWRSIRLIWQRTTTITVPILHEAGDRGVLVSHGDQGGGYVVYVDGDRAHLVLNDGYGRMTRLDGGPVPPGEHTVVVRIEAPGGWRWNLSIGVDGGEAARVDDLRMLFPMAPFEGISVGTERRSPVDWDLFQREGPFPYNGTLHHVRYEPGDPAPDAPSTFVELAKQLGSRYE